VNPLRDTDIRHPSTQPQEACTVIPVKNPKITPEQRFAQLMRQARTEQARSQGMFAGRVMYSLRNIVGGADLTTWRQSTVAKTEAAERPIRLDEFMAICDALGLDPAAVVSDLHQTVKAGTSRELADLDERGRAIAAARQEAKAALARLEKEASEVEDRRTALTAEFADEED
jgi:hypothetical protein